MNVGSWLAWGFVATLVMTVILSGSQGLGLTRINMPYLLGTLFTPNRDRAKLYGAAVHVLDGWVFSLIYVLLFQVLHRATWWMGGLLGLLHGVFILTVTMPAMPAFHPRMASATHGPEPSPGLEPPGFFGLNYGASTPLSLLLAHAVFGAILGAFYVLR
jgi:hypothetical protein